MKSFRKVIVALVLVMTLGANTISASAATITWTTTESTTQLVTTAATSIYNGCYEIRSVLTVLGTIPQGATVNIKGYCKTTSENWYKLEYNGITGYAPSTNFAPKTDWTSVYALMNQLGGGSMNVFSEDVVVSFLAGTLCGGNLTAKQKAQNVHDYLCMNMTYDYTYTCYTIHNALYDGTGVCQAYANAFEAIMDAAGIETDFIGGVALNTDGNIELHAWNRCLVDGTYYYIDTTWDDEGKYAGTKYFWSTDETFAGTHLMTELNPVREKQLE